MSGQWALWAGLWVWPVVRAWELSGRGFVGRVPGLCKQGLWASWVPLIGLWAGPVESGVGCVGGILISLGGALWAVAQCSDWYLSGR